MTEEHANKVRWVYSSSTNEELAERYDQWAAQYEQDLDLDFGYAGPQRAADVFERFVPKDGRVLDAGVGTGLAGRFLHDRGYRHLVGIDLSKGMLDEAAKKDVYLELRQMVLGHTLDFKDGEFDAVVCVGTLTEGHAPASSLSELIRVTKMGGHVIFTLRPDIHRDAGFQERQEAYVVEGRWRLVEVTDEFQVLPKGEPEVMYQVWVYEVQQGAEV